MTVEAAAGSSLCLQCGLCCRGVLHDHVVLRPGEVPQARSLGLTVQPNPRGGSVFALPCPQLAEDHRCRVYGQRPHSCGAYRCRVLAGYEQGRRSLRESLDLVTKAREMFESLDRRIPQDPERTVWQRLENHLGDRRASVDVQADAARLLVWTRKHFKGRDARPEGGA